MNTQDAPLSCFNKNAFLFLKRLVCPKNATQTLAYKVDVAFESFMQLFGALLALKGNERFRKIRN